MKERFKSVCVVALQIYFFTVFFLAAPYFNWRYAREHGVVSWIAFGEIVATAKAAIWPYYALTGFGSGSRPDRTDVHFANSRIASYEAFRIINRFDGVAELPRKEASDVAQLLQAAVTEADLVEDAYLQKIHYH